jgi:coupling of ubiquitin conjugation to ER degradation protein 1
MAEAQTISLPQILVFLVIGFLVVRWLFSSNAPAAPGAQNNTTAHGSRVNPAHVEQLMSMFPQLDRRTAIWELQRNGGNVNRIAETVLSGGRLSVVSHGLRVVQVLNYANKIIATTYFPTAYASTCEFCSRPTSNAPSSFSS